MGVITERHLQRARSAGACDDEMQNLRVGVPISYLRADVLGFCVNVFPADEIDAIARQMLHDTVAVHFLSGIDPYFIGGSGYGSGFGSGYGSGSGSGYGEGYGNKNTWHIAGAEIIDETNNIETDPKLLDYQILSRVDRRGTQ